MVNLSKMCYDRTVILVTFYFGNYNLQAIVAR